MATTDATEQLKPDHVPEELYLDRSYEEYAQDGDDPYLAISRLHDGPGIVWFRDVLFGQPGWVLAPNDYVREAFMDWEHFSSDYATMQLLGMDWKLNPLEFDPPEHHYYRRILNPYFTPATAKGLDAPVRAACDSLIAQFEGRGSCEFISEFAENFPSYVFLDLMGMPREKLPDFLTWERDMLREKDFEKRLGAMQAVLEYLQEFVAEQKKSPTTGLLKGMVTASYNGERPLNDGELLGMCYLLYIAGLDTVLSTLGWVVKHLAGDPALRERLHDNPDDIPKAVDEFVRAYAVPTPTRRARGDFEFHGVSMKAGDLVLLSTPAAARDPRTYEDPHKVDIDRQTRNVTFATGPHICLGMHLAKRELTTVVEAVVTRFRDIRIPEGEKYEYHTGGVFGIDRLPLEFELV